ncbi:hypothetical protein AB3N04_00845 (plasmid) [Alkalihalophilus sp. As8PL]|uniref:Type II secretion system protein GspF domain-containing protein n=1 Tax=Alkalihalophilus sp. As8PL TaxID=3237103 RepID=A0AB39BMX0_9BACI
MVGPLLEVTMKLIGYTAFFYGLWGIASLMGFNKAIQKASRNQKRLRAARKLAKLNEDGEKTKKSSTYTHLERLLSSIKSQKNIGIVEVVNFIIISLLLFITSFSVIYTMLGSIEIAVMVSVSVGLAPYFYARFKLASIRNKTSYAFMNVVTTFLQIYQSSQKDLYYTFYQSVKDVEDPYMQPLMMRLLSAIQKDRSEVEFKKSIEVFMYSVNTVFAKRFGKLIINGHLRNADISQSLKSLHDDIKKRKQDMEREKTFNLEAVLVGYMPLILLPYVVYLGYQTAGVRDFWYYFNNERTLFMFVICLIGTIFSLFLATLLRKPKADM